MEQILETGIFVISFMKRNIKLRHKNLLTINALTKIIWVSQKNVKTHQKLPRKFASKREFMANFDSNFISEEIFDKKFEKYVNDLIIFQ